MKRSTIPCAFVLAAAIGCSATTQGPEQTERTSLALREEQRNGGACSGTMSGPINLPADDSVHPFDPASVEWWYYSSHLETDDGREFGFAQILYATLPSPDAATPIQYVDSTVTDVAEGRYHFGGRQFAFGAPTVVPNGFDFSVGTERITGGDGHDSVHGVVSDGGRSYVVDLRLESEKSPVLHMADGYVNYYSRERMRATGTIAVDGHVYQVHGHTWFDHQFGPQKIELATVANWTWIATQLDDRRELFLLVVNRQDGTQLVTGALSDADCKTRQLGALDFTATPLGSWAPPDGGCQYPMGWHVEVPSAQLSLNVHPRFSAQEIWVPGMDRYWEGDSVVNREGDAASVGRAYVELYGFCAP